ncbi:siderophore-interacting protein [Mycobacterium sp. Aquia_216]|uniref:siderophore-interacting protein n=1 Tax=Mycobacterium sp. Aquia_216 TaxID=2991729 RepID=UPI00227B27DC|nr:siderophore-interacting protein [Mycobacterium sp. Aquia_216]WAJ44350.1 siderophore-interacting protein [Mycobacterium sp. Aquia_216]
MAPITARLSDLAADMLFTSVCVSEVTELVPRFVKVSLSGEAFTRAKWTPGDKLQLRPRRGSLAMRAYTPINWDREEGVTDVIGFRHGDGPAVRWFENATIGTDCEIFGPSRSLDLSDTAPGTIFIGDETSIGLAYALSHVNPAAQYIYEAADPVALSDVLTTLGLTAATDILAKSADRNELLHQIVGAAEAGKSSTFDLVVTGDAATVNAVRRGLRRWPHVTPRIKARAYWAAGHSGLS